MIIDSDLIPAGYSSAAIKALCSLADRGAHNATALATVCRFSTAAATGLLDTLEKKGLAMRVRDLEDRRAVNVIITHRGRELVESLRPQAPATPAQAAA